MILIQNDRDTGIYAKFYNTNLLKKIFSRHCGRILCNKCSGHDVPIVKFGLNKPVRVCAVCFDVLQVGTE